MSIHLATSGTEKVCLKKSRLLRWNEIVHKDDGGEDLVVFLIRNEIVINKFPKQGFAKDDDELKQRCGLICRELKRSGFPDFEAFLLTDGELPPGTNHPVDVDDQIFLNSTWKDVHPFPRSAFCDPCFDDYIMQSIDRDVFHPESYFKLKGQIRNILKRQYSFLPGNLDREAEDHFRYVLVFDVYRFRSISWKILETHIKDIGDYFGLPSNPGHMKVCEYFFNPDHEGIGLVPQVYQESDVLVTEPHPIIDLLKPQDDYLGIVGFLRASILSRCMVEDMNGVLELLKLRFSGDPKIYFPRSIMSMYNGGLPYLADIPPHHPYPVVYDKTFCHLCHDSVALSDSYSEVNCDKASHIFHSKCYSEWAKSYTHICPYCDRKRK